MAIKVGILSMQRIFNYGSFLQAYGLKNILEEIGCEVQFVDYHPGYCLIPSNNRYGIKRKLSKAVEVFKCSASFAEKICFIKYKKNYAANYYPYLGITDEMNYTPNVDVLVIGSDEVFNCIQNNTNVGYSPELFGVGSNAKKLISYAASFGNTTISQLNEYRVSDEITKWLKDFNAISVRDANSGMIVKQLIGKEPEFNLDPVLIYDFAGNCKDVSVNILECKYMILYGYSGRFSKLECASIKKYADQNDMKIFCIGGIQSCCDEFIDCNPFEVITYFQHAECVITDTFHGTILSVITHRNFVSFVRNSGYGNSEKLVDLLNRLKLIERKVEDIKNLDKILAQPIFYDPVDSVIMAERQHTYHYLKEQIIGQDGL